ncbi:MAG: aromatic acid exporter family protein [Ornithinimicrobium sp.]
MAAFSHLPGWSTFRARLASPNLLADLLQVLKAVVAAVIAWVVAHEVLGLEQAFLAPWTALLTVHATVHRTVWRGAQTVLATVLGVVLATSIAAFFGVSAWTLALSLLVGLLIARVSVLREEGTTVATTALFLITTGYGTRQEPLLIDRLLDVGLGVGIALVVNLVVIPPLNDRNAQRRIDDVDRELGSLLVDMAHQMKVPWQSQDTDDWIERTRSIDTDLQEAWSFVRFADESARWNPRSRRRPPNTDGLSEILKRLEEGVAQTRSIARHVRESSRQAQQWDQLFGDRFIELLELTGNAVADPDQQVAELRDQLHTLADDLSGEDLPGMQWPLYGALIANLQMIIDVVDDVATAQPVRT